MSLARIYIISTMALVLVTLSLTQMFPVSATTGELGVIHNFTLSPDARKLLFVSERFDGEGRSFADAMLVDIATKKVTGLTGEIREAIPSPDEKLIAYVKRDTYYGYSLIISTADGNEIRLRYHIALHYLHQLRWSQDSKYLSFVSARGGQERAVIISPQLGLVLDELAAIQWRETMPLLPTHPLYQDKPILRANSTVIWGDNETIYVGAVDGIWQGEFVESFVIHWHHLVEAGDINTLIMAPTGTHLLYTRDSDVFWASWIWVLPVDDVAEPIRIGQGSNTQFTPDGRHVLYSYLGLRMASLDGKSSRQLTGQISVP